MGKRVWSAPGEIGEDAVIASVGTTVVAMLPACRVKNVLLRCLGHEIADSARIGPNLVIGVQKIVLGDEARVGPFNVFLRLKLLHLSRLTLIGNLNWIAAVPVALRKEARSSLRLGEHSALTSRHYVDASGSVEIGRYSTVAGLRSTILSHSVDLNSGRQVATPTTVGEYCFLGTNVCVLPGASLPSRSVLAAGSVLGRSSNSSEGIWRGNPATFERPSTGAYFSRTDGVVEW